MTTTRSVPRLLFVINDAPFFVSHRLVLAIAARTAGFEVHVASAPAGAVATITAAGAIHHALPISRSGLGPLAELRTILCIYRLLRQLRPDVLHLVTPKAVIYGGIAARMAGIHPVIAAISGLGQVFVSGSVLRRIARVFASVAYRVALRGRGTIVITQNPADADRLVEMGAARRENLVMIRGSGVDLAEYPYLPEPPGDPVVVFAARLLRSKGISEFVDAAQRLRAAGLAARFVVAGDADPGNTASVSAQEIDDWRRSGIVEMLGHRTDIARLFGAAHIVALPSYYGEGLPKVLIEAAACGRAVVTTDMPGCRDAVDPGVTGLLVPPRDVSGLAAAIEELVRNPGRRAAMGAAGRALAERAFDVRGVVEQHLHLYREASRAT